MNLSECKPLVERYTRNNPGWFTIRESEPVQLHSGVTLEHRRASDKYRKTKVGTRGFARIENSVVECYVMEKQRVNDDFFLIVSPVLSGEKIKVSVLEFSQRKGNVI